MDIYEDLERIVPPEHKDAFLRLSRQIKEYGDHNPELLRLVEAMGLLSLYTERLPRRIAGESERGVAALQNASAARPEIDVRCTDAADAIAQHMVFPDVEKVEALIDGNAETAKSIHSRLAASRRWNLLITAALAALYFVGGAWFVWNDHRSIHQTIYEKVAVGTKDALERLKPDWLQQHTDTLKPLINSGISISTGRDNDGNIVLFFRGEPGVTWLSHPTFQNGYLTITVTH